MTPTIPSLASLTSRASLTSLAAANAIAALIACAACASTPAPPSASPATAATPAPTSPPAHTVSAVVLVNGCAHFGVENARLAEAAMNQLVDGCSGFTGERVQFTATLLPGGAIQFEPRPQDSLSIPVCVLNHPLTHKVRLQKACSLDVRLEEGTVAVPRSADAGP
jgi:hypothetical protein